MIKEFLQLVRSVCIVAIVMFVFTFIFGFFGALLESFESFFVSDEYYDV